MVTLNGDNMLGLDDLKMMAVLQGSRTTLDPAAAYELESDFREAHGPIARHIGNLASGHNPQYRAGVMVGAALMAEVVDGTLLDDEIRNLTATFAISPYTQLQLF